MLSQQVVARFAGRVVFRVEDLGRSVLAARHEIEGYPILFVDGEPIVRPLDFGPRAGPRYAPWQEAEARDRFQGDLEQHLRAAVESLADAPGLEQGIAECLQRIAAPREGQTPIEGRPNRAALEEVRAALERGDRWRALDLLGDTWASEEKHWAEVAFVRSKGTPGFDERWEAEAPVLAGRIAALGVVPRFGPLALDAATEHATYRARALMGIARGTAFLSPSVAYGSLREAAGWIEFAESCRCFERGTVAAQDLPDPAATIERRRQRLRTEFETRPELRLDFEAVSMNTDWKVAEDQRSLGMVRAAWRSLLDADVERAVRRHVGPAPLVEELHSRLADLEGWLLDDELGLDLSLAARLHEGAARLLEGDPTAEDCVRVSALLDVIETVPGWPG